MQFESIRYDAAADVLYVKMAGQIVASAPIPGDDFVILNRNAAGEVIGLQLLDVASLSASRWVGKFQTGEIPEPMFWLVDALLRRIFPKLQSDLEAGRKYR
jgi:uncharacterized protein YuzE